jgi:hypothetical protein
MQLSPCDVYREQLRSLAHGHPIWKPDPANLYERVSIGDVGYVREGYFVRILNVLLPSDDPSNRLLGEPEPYPRLDFGPFGNVRHSKFFKGDYYSRFVTPIPESTASAPEKYVIVSVSDVCGPRISRCSFTATTFRCKRRGAALTLPHDGQSEDVIRTKVFEDYIRDHVESWFSFARRHNLDVERMEDLILVTGCTLVSSWGITAFPDDTLDAEVSLRSQASDGGGGSFDWREVRPGAIYQNSNQDPVRPLRHITSSFANLSFVISKEQCTPESMHIHQGLPSEARLYIDQPSGHSRPPSRRC